MPIQWLWLLWPLAGLLAWGWLGYTTYKLELVSTSNKIGGILGCMAWAPLALLMAWAEASEQAPEHRYGLRFW